MPESEMRRNGFIPLKESDVGMTRQDCTDAARPVERSANDPPFDREKARQLALTPYAHMTPNRLRELWDSHYLALAEIDRLQADRDRWQAQAIEERAIKGGYGTWDEFPEAKREERRKVAARELGAEASDWRGIGEEEKKALKEVLDYLDFPVGKGQLPYLGNGRKVLRRLLEG